MSLKLSTSIFAAATFAMIGAAQAQDEAQPKVYEPEVCGRVEQDFQAQAQRFNDSIAKGDRPQLLQVAVDPLSPDFLGCLDAVVARADGFVNDAFDALPAGMKMSEQELMERLDDAGDMEAIFDLASLYAAQILTRDSQSGIREYIGLGGLTEDDDSPAIWKLHGDAWDAVYMARRSAEALGLGYDMGEFEYLSRAFSALENSSWMQTVPYMERFSPFRPDFFSFEKGWSPS